MPKCSFANHPDLTAAIHEVGMTTFLRFLRTESDFAQWIDPRGGSGSNHLVELVDAQVLVRCSALRSEELTPEAVDAVLDEVNQALPGLNPKGPHSLQGFIDCAGYVIMNYCKNLSQLDAYGKGAATMVREGQADWQKLLRNKLECDRKDPGQIAWSYVAGLCLHDTDRTAHRVLQKSLELIIAKELRKDPLWLEKYRDDTPFYRVRDWVRSAVANNADWLSNVDERGCPRKLAKCASLEAMVAEADKQMKKDISRSGPPTESYGTPYADHGGPFCMVRLNSPAALDYESSHMRHCIGNGGYDRFIGREDHLLLSLRDRAGQPHLTIEVVDKKVVQFQGKANSIPKDEYRDAAEQLLSAMGIEFTTVENLRGQLSEGARNVIRQWMEENPNSGLDLTPHNPWVMHPGQ